MPKHKGAKEAEKEDQIIECTQTEVGLIKEFTVTPEIFAVVI